MYLIGIVRKDKTKSPVLFRIQKYNKAMPNALLQSEQMTGYLLPEERRDLTKRMGIPAFQ